MAPEFIDISSDSDGEAPCKIVFRKPPIANAPQARTAPRPAFQSPRALQLKQSPCQAPTRQASPRHPQPAHIDLASDSEDDPISLSPFIRRGYTSRHSVPINAKVTHQDRQIVPRTTNPLSSATISGSPTSLNSADKAEGTPGGRVEHDVRKDDRALIGEDASNSAQTSMMGPGNDVVQGLKQKRLEVLDLDSSDPSDDSMGDTEPMVAYLKRRTSHSDKRRTKRPRIQEHNSPVRDIMASIDRIQAKLDHQPRPRSSTLKVELRPRAPLAAIPTGITTSNKQDTTVETRPTKVTPIQATSMKATPVKFTSVRATFNKATSMHGSRYTPEEDALLVELRKDGITWDQMPSHFVGRTRASLQTHYSTTLAHRIHERQGPHRIPGVSTKPPLDLPPSHDVLAGSDSAIERVQAPRRKTIRRTNCDPLDLPSDPEETVSSGACEVEMNRLLRKPMQSRQTSRSVLLRHRQLGVSSMYRSLVGVKNSVSDSFGPVKYLDDASGDVSTIAWSPNGRTFAAGAVTITDSSSMHYNRPRNLLLGALDGPIRELPEHHVPRPIMHRDNATVVASQDPRLFATVQMVAFSGCGQRMYSAAIDHKVNVYDIGSNNIEKSSYMYSIPHSAPVDLLSVSSKGLVATGTRNFGADCIKIIRCDEDGSEELLSLSARDNGYGQPIYSSALKWGVAPHQSNYLLAGFAQEKQILYQEDDSLDILGETCLWDATTGQRINVTSTGRNVFDVAWNPNYGQSVFAVASVGNGKLNHGMHSVIRLFGGTSASMRHHIELECPAHDINDVVFCPYDEHLLATGSTDAIVHVWDVRHCKSGQTPLRTFRHGDCLSVLPHAKKRWEADTGIRFLSWGATHTRLYSGSSDGVVKAWNPYVADEDSYIGDVATFTSAIMSGAFSPDYSSLLIGEDQGRINLLTVGNDDRTMNEMDRFDVLHALEPPSTAKFAHTALLESGEIEFRPFGSLPIRQAVQGPNYIQYNCDKGLNADDSDDDDFLDGIGSKDSETHLLRDRAAAFQRTLNRMRLEWETLHKHDKTDPCTLDCDYKPYLFNEDGNGVTDSQRSLSRIPTELVHPPPKGLKAYARGLVARCSRCAAPAHAPDRPTANSNSNKPEAILCEKCAFACFRCSSDAGLSETKDKVFCQACGLTWSVGSLGYEIVEDVALKNKHALRGPGLKRMRMQSATVEDNGEELGDSERERWLDLFGH